MWIQKLSKLFFEILVKFHTNPQLQGHQIIFWRSAITVTLQIARYAQPKPLKENKSTPYYHNYDVPAFSKTHHCTFTVQQLYMSRTHKTQSQ